MAKATLAVQDRPTAADGLPTHGLVRLAQILAVVPVARSTLWYWIETGKFPRPIKIGPRASAWRVEDVRRLLMAAPTVTPETIDPNVAAAVAQRVANRAAAKTKPLTPAQKGARTRATNRLAQGAKAMAELERREAEEAEEAERAARKAELLGGA